MKSFFLRYYLHGICIGILLFLIITAFKQLPQTFYQQDEWLGLGGLMSIGWKSVTQGVSIGQLLFADGRPFTRILGYFFYKLFTLGPVPVALYSIFFHGINTILVYFIVYKLLKKKLFALLGSSYFAVASMAHQSVTWFGASFGEQPASFFIFLSILFFLHFLASKKKLYMYTASFCAIVSLYFKESGVFLIPLYVGIVLFLRKSFPIKKYGFSYILLSFFGLAFIGFRLFEMISTAMPYQSGVYINSVSQNIFLTMATRAFFYPLTSFSLMFVPYPAATFLSEWLWKLYYPFIVDRPDLVFQTVMLDLIAVILSGILLVLCYIISQRKDLKKIIIFTLTFFVLSVFPYIAIAKQYAYMEPRYYYIPLLSASILIAALFTFLYTSKRTVLKIFLFIGIVLYLLYLRYNITIIRHDIAVQVDIANERKSFIHQLYSYYPTLHSNTNIFLFIGDKSWLSERNFTPFQNGFGYTLMVLYYTSGKIPSYLPSTQYLWNFDDEGLKTFEGLTYGYFNSLEDLKTEVKKENINPADVHAFYYHRNTKKLSNITQGIQKELVNDN